MRFANRPHPLQSSRFWFMILACVAATAMWQMGMFRGEPNLDEEFQDLTELDLSDESLEPEQPDPRGPRGEPLRQTAMATDAEWASDTAPAGQSDVASDSTTGNGNGWWQTNEPDMLPADTADHAHPAGQTEPQPLAATTSPFGPANPEFVAVGEEQTEPVTNAENEASPFPEWDGANPPSTESDVQTAAARVVQPAGDTTATPAANTVAGAAFDFSMIDNLLAQNDDVGAHRELSTLYWQRPELRPLLIERIQQTARKIYFQPTPHYMEAYVVQPGDTLQSVAQRYEVSWQFLAKLNQVEPTQIRPGQELKVIRGPFSAVVDLSDFEITIHAHGYFVCRFPVGTGADNSTPIGTFKIDDKLVDPTYYGRDGVVAHDDPTNPLGEHWLSIGDSYGIHGTIDPDSIGRAESQGCVRLRNEDVAEVYDFLTVGSEVVIRE